MIPTAGALDLLLACQALPVQGAVIEQACLGLLHGLLPKRIGLRDQPVAVIAAFGQASVCLGNLWDVLQSVG